MSQKLDPKIEKELVEKAKESLQAFDRLYDHYLPRIYGYLYNRTLKKEIAEDVTSQTFVKAMVKIKDFSYQGYTFGAWLYRIAHNTLIDYFRKHKKLLSLEEQRIESDDRSEEEAEDFERKIIVLKALRRLPEQYQEVLSLRYFEELSNEEIAQVVGCKKETLAVKMHRSLEALKKILKSDEFKQLLTISN